MNLKTSSECEVLSYNSIDPPGKQSRIWKKVKGKWLFWWCNRRSAFWYVLMLGTKQNFWLCTLHLFCFFLFIVWLKNRRAVIAPWLNDRAEWWETYRRTTRLSTNWVWMFHKWWNSIWQVHTIWFLSNKHSHRNYTKNILGHKSSKAE